MEEGFEFEIIPFDDPIFADIEQKDIFGEAPYYDDIKKVSQRMTAGYKRSEKKTKRIRKKANNWLQNLLPPELEKVKMKRRQRVKINGTDKRPSLRPLEKLKVQAKTLIIHKRLDSLISDPFAFARKKNKEKDIARPESIPNHEPDSGNLYLNLDDSIEAAKVDQDNYHLQTGLMKIHKSVQKYYQQDFILNEIKIILSSYQLRTFLENVRPFAYKNGFKLTFPSDLDYKHFSHSLVIVDQKNFELLTDMVKNYKDISVYILVVVQNVSYF